VYPAETTPAHLQKQAEQVVLQQGKSPMLQPGSSQAGSTLAVTATASVDDSLVLLGYDFDASPLCKGADFSLVSKLLQLICHKPSVVNRMSFCETLRPHQVGVASEMGIVA
jgi:hypothetical protein